MDWEIVIGLETHAQLSTESKIFSGASTTFGAPPNTQACEVDIALPGVLPVLNIGAVDRAIQTLQSNAYQPTVVLTGGDASRILNALCETPLHRPHLVLQGLAHMLDTAR